MINKEQIHKWLLEGTISEAQADKMLADCETYCKNKLSNKLITSVSTIGAIFLGLGVILFIASNWQEMPNIAKLILLIGGTFAVFWSGYYGKYQRQNFPRVGEALIFLAALLFGGDIFLLAQMYHINADAHFLVLIWLLGILPFVYAFNSSSIATLALLLFLLWLPLYNCMDISGAEFMVKMPIIYLVTGILLFELGALHYLLEKFKKIARVYRLTGIKITMVTLFCFSFKECSSLPMQHAANSAGFAKSFVVFVIIALVLAATALFFNPRKEKNNVLEHGVTIGLLGFALIFYFFPSNNGLYAIFFNLILAGIIALLFFIGYQKEDAQVVNIAMSWLSLLILVRYFDFCWLLLPRALFFMVGGLILVISGIAIEKQRKQLQIKFKQASLVKKDEVSV